MTLNKKGFTLIELLVVIAMIGIILGAMTTSVRAAQERARIQKATNDVKVLSQIVLASENFGTQNKLEAIGGTGPDSGADLQLSYLDELARKDPSGKTRTLLQASTIRNGMVVDPWGHPYKIQIKEGSPDVKLTSASGAMQTGFVLPNFYRLSAEERQ